MSFSQVPPPNYRPRMPYGGGGNRGFRPRGPWGGHRGRGGPRMYGPPMFNPQDVFMWLDHQDPMLLQQVHFHVSWLLEQHGMPPGGPPPGAAAAEGEDDGSGEEEEEGGGGGGGNGGPPGDDDGGNVDSSWFADDSKKEGAADEGPDAKRPKMPAPGRQNQMQWTPGGWVVKDNYHKVTTATKPVPSQDVLPARPCEKYPDVGQDRTKLGMLMQNIHMMEFELQKLCQRYRITSKLTKDTDFSAYPEDQKERLKTAVNCVTNAHKTLNDFKEYLVEEKYSEWNEEQKKLREATVKAMIGDMPSGTPHRGNLSGADGENAPAGSDKAPEAEMVMDAEGKAKIVFKGDEPKTEESRSVDDEKDGGPPGASSVPVPPVAMKPLESSVKSLDEIEAERRAAADN